MAPPAPVSEPLPELALFLLSADGTEEQAQAFGEREFDAVAARLDDSPVEPPRVSKVFTAYLYPEKHDLRTLREDLVPIHFPWADAELLAEVMRREVDHLYTVSGEDRVRTLSGSITYSQGFYVTGRGDDPGVLIRNIVPFETPQDAREAGRLTWLACDAAIRDVFARAQTSLTLTEASAAAIADADLGAALSEIYTEAPRYLDILGRPQRATAEQLLSDDLPESRVQLKGPDLAKLVGALRSIQERRRAVTRAVSAHEDAVEQVRRDQVSSGRPGATAEAVTAAAEDLALAVLVEAETFPILHRIWTMPDLPSSIVVVPHPRDDEPWITTASIARPEAAGVSRASARSGADAIVLLKRAILGTLRRSAEGNRDFTAALAASPENVWRYPPLIARALDQLVLRDPSVGFRAAQDRMVDESGMSLLATLNLVSAGLSTAAWLTSAAPPVSLALAVVGGALGLADTVQDYSKRVEQEDAFAAALDPSRSVASQPGYLGIVVAVAFNLLDIKGVADAYRAVRFAAPSVAAADALGLVAP
jgi:hypothetical protein